MFIIKAAGITKINPSILSNNPPWPGNIDPVSFTFACLLKYEINKSPSWHIKDKNKDIKINWEIFFCMLSTTKFKSISLKNNQNIINGNREKIKDPMLPDIVLFGLMFVNFLPPTNLPTI